MAVIIILWCLTSILELRRKRLHTMQLFLSRNRDPKANDGTGAQTIIIVISSRTSYIIEVQPSTMDPASSPIIPFTNPISTIMELCPSTPRPLKRKMVLSIDREDIYVPTARGGDDDSRLTIHIADLPSLPFPKRISNENEAPDKIMSKISVKPSRTSASSFNSPLSSSSTSQECNRSVSQHDRDQKNYIARCA